MSNYDFWCPNCGQKMSGDPTYRGKSLACPSCKRTMTVPVRPIDIEGPAPSAAGGSPAPAAPPASSSKPAGSPSPPSRPSASRSGKKSIAESETGRLALAALVGSILAIPGIIFGHLALAPRRKASPKERQLALTGLVLGYCVLAAGLAFLAVQINLAAHKPKALVRDDPKTGAVSPARIVDEVKIGDAASETAHKLLGIRSTTGDFGDRHWRATRKRPGGSFSYVMKVLPDQPMALNCTYWGSDTDHREFDIAMNGAVFAHQKLDFGAPGHFFDMEYPIPPDFTRGKNEVTIEFRSAKGESAGGVFGCQMLKK
jgi:hypothetical protein